MGSSEQVRKQARLFRGRETVPIEIANRFFACMVAFYLALDMLKRKMQKHGGGADAWANRFGAGDNAAEHAAIVANVPRVDFHHKVAGPMQVSCEYKRNIKHVGKYSLGAGQRIDREAGKFAQALAVFANSINFRSITLISQQAAARVGSYCDGAKHPFVGAGNECRGARGGGGG